MKAKPVTNAAEAVATFKPCWPRGKLRTQECFLVLCLDTQHYPLGKPVVVGVGTVNSVVVHPRDVFRTAVKRNAVAVIVAHNHPSGSLEASSDDHRLISRLRTAGDLLGIPVLDSIIIGADGTFAPMAP